MNVTNKKIIFLSVFLLSALSPFSESSAGSNTYSVGVEGFRDTYKESSLDLSDKTNYGSVTGYYARQSGRIFGALDGRISYGTDDYNSPSGHVSGVPQWESDFRARFGLSLPLWGGSLSPYTGIGWRYFQDQGKNYSTDLGANAYDRRISQFYVPIGASLSYTTDDGWSITPMAEADVMFYGNVDSRLTNNQFNYVPGAGIVQFLTPANNTQHFGYGGRSELMFGKAFEGCSWQIGPFIRYWHVSESDKITYINTNTGGAGVTVDEPENTRTQVGLAAKLLW